MLEEYSPHQLAYDTDVLLALFGLSRAFASTSNDVSLASTWQEDLFRGLTWCRGKWRLPNWQTSQPLSVD